MPPNGSFHCEVENLETDQYGNKVVTIKCHGRLVSGNSREVNEAVKPLIPLGGRIIVDLGDVD